MPLLTKKCNILADSAKATERGEVRISEEQPGPAGGREEDIEEHAGGFSGPGRRLYVQGSTEKHLCQGADFIPCADRVSPVVQTGGGDRGP